ncbi:MerR family transcriptional regulator [Bradyrhizobium sp. Arg62]|uniref:MerR family transcriptional regulator n=1 Tax=Bradyrhizobium brasilense TaxID=1419277 RepID=UPI001E64B7D5|nr:MerR family transcriptional regulator [Bradyrhizobium brasilense]MCC8945440.1 MerR family transcriptional regulator [Bradyrhizobium brasilense]
MKKNQLMSPMQITSELGVVYGTVKLWVRQGHLKPATYTAGGHARYARADVEAIKSREPAAARLSSPAPAAETSDPKKLSTEIEEAMLAAARGREAIERLVALQSEAVQRATGVSRAELCLLLWNAPMAQVATRLGLDRRLLVFICVLCEVPTPPQGYWSTSIDRRSIRLTRL